VDYRDRICSTTARAKGVINELRERSDDPEAAEDRGARRDAEEGCGDPLGRYENRPAVNRAAERVARKFGSGVNARFEDQNAIEISRAIWGNSSRVVQGGNPRSMRHGNYAGSASAAWRSCFPSASQAASLFLCLPGMRTQASRAVRIRSDGRRETPLRSSSFIGRLRLRPRKGGWL
jgi:hypothetical protein